MTVKDKFPETPHVAICIATYKRPGGLRSLLESIDAQQFLTVQPRVTIVISDNAPEDPATAVLGDAAALTKWPVIYVTEPVRGIAAARNCTLSNAPDDADFIAFVDDDERVSASWLENMLITLRDTDATAVQGPVEPDFDHPPKKWIEELSIFRIGPFLQGQKLNFAATNNSVLNACTVREHNMRFDMRFNQTGGEDEEFYDRVRDAGGIIRAAANAIVFDNVPRQRLSLHWILRRAYRKGNTLGRIAILRKRGRSVRIVKAGGAIGWGLGAAVFSALGSRTLYFRGLLEVCRGCGMLGAFLKISLNEYSDQAVGVDRKQAAHNEG